MMSPLFDDLHSSASWLRCLGSARELPCQRRGGRGEGRKRKGGQRRGWDCIRASCSKSPGLRVKALSQSPWQTAPFLTFKTVNFVASLVAQWLRVCLPMQGTRVRALVWEDPTCRGATKPVCHNY